MSIEVKVKLWLENDSSFILGKGRATLLSRVEQYGSIAEAARSMSMSYSHAWSEIRDMGMALGEPVVETARGGKSGGSAKLTSAGKDILEKYRKEMERLDRHLAGGD